MCRHIVLTAAWCEVVLAVAARADVNKMHVSNLGLIFSQCMALPPQLFKMLLHHAHTLFPSTHAAGAHFPWPDAATALSMDGGADGDAGDAGEMDAAVSGDLLSFGEDDVYNTDGVAAPAPPVVGPSPAARWGATTAPAPTPDPPRPAAVPPPIGPSPSARALMASAGILPVLRPPPAPPAVGPSPAARSQDAAARSLEPAGPLTSGWSRSSLDTGAAPTVGPSPAARAFAATASTDALPLSQPPPPPPPVGPSPAARSAAMAIPAGALARAPTTGSSGSLPSPGAGGPSSSRSMEGTTAHAHARCVGRPRWLSLLPGGVRTHRAPTGRGRQGRCGPDR
jgi:hypothetical protein